MTNSASTSLIEATDWWSAFSQRYGLKEKWDKAQLVKRGLLESLEGHPLAGAVCACAEVLGGHVGNKGRGARPLETKRLNDAALVARRIALLPLPRVAKLEACRSSVLAKASYGWTQSKPTKRACNKLDQSVHQAAGGLAQMLGRRNHAP